MEQRKFGWKPDLPDHRDHICHLAAMPGVSRNVDLRKTGNFPPVFNQGDTNTCTGQAISSAVQYGMRCQSKEDFIPSRLFIYYNERAMIGTTSVDDGAYIRDGIKSVASQGVVSEELWPFDVSKITTKPTDNVYQEALKGVIKQYSRVPIKLHNIQNVLTHNIPIVFGASLYESFMSEEVMKTGVVTLPKKTEKFLGGHAMLMVGSTANHFIVRNSWGPEWGDGGYCYIPHQYLIDENLADDFWAIFLV